MLPPGWITASDPISGRIYYANASTGETSWEAPILSPPPAPNPPHQPPTHLPIHMLHQGGPSPTVQPTANFPNPIPHISSIPQPPFYPQHMTTNNPLPIPMNANIIPNNPPVAIHHPGNPNMTIPNIPQPTSIQPQILPSVPIIDPAVSGAMLVPTIRSMIDQIKQQEQAKMQQEGLSSNDIEVQMELPFLSAGTIADLCNVTREYKMEQRKLLKAMKNAAAAAVTHNNKEEEEDEEPNEEDLFVSYKEPLKPHDMPIGARPPHIEPGRVDIRLMALFDQLHMLHRDETRLSRR